MFPYMEEHRAVASPALYYDFEHARKLILKKDPLEVAREADVVFHLKNVALYDIIQL